MTNYNVISQGIKLVLDYIESFWGGCPQGTEQLYTNYILDWYNNTDITNPRVLASLALQFGKYKMINYEQEKEATDNYYPI